MASLENDDRFFNGAREQQPLPGSLWLEGDVQDSWQDELFCIGYEEWADAMERDQQAAEEWEGMVDSAQGLPF